MVASLTYRTNDVTRWGGGQGSDLAAVTIDLNFWTLFSAVQGLQSAASVGAGIDFINQPANGNLFFIHLTDHRVLGPFVIPSSQWNGRGEWAPLTAYAPFDVVSNNGSLYLITIAHTSVSTFSAFATDGLGHSLYVLILSSPANSLPTGGVAGQRLAKASGSPFVSEWVTDFIRMFVFVSGQPNSGETLLQYTVADHMTLFAGLPGTVIHANTPTQSHVSYTLNKNGSAIGSIDFVGPSPFSVSVTFPANVTFVPGDIITLVAPALPDAAQADISFTIVASLTL